MGTRADFYVGRGESAEWLGSIAWDGYPSGIPDSVLKAKTEKTFRKAVNTMLAGRDDSTYPRDGWPWPWEDSKTTDYAYALDGKKVWASCYGHAWFDPAKPLEDDCAGDKVAVFPNMKTEQNVTLGRRSGISIFVDRGSK